MRRAIVLAVLFGALFSGLVAAQSPRNQPQVAAVADDDILALWVDTPQVFRQLKWSLVKSELASQGFSQAALGAVQVVNFTAAMDILYPLNSSVTSVTLPDIPTLGGSITFCDAGVDFAANNVAVVADGSDTLDATVGTLDSDGQCYTFLADTNTNEWYRLGGGGAGGGGGGGSILLDLLDDASNESAAIAEIATTNDTNSIFTEPSADKLLVDVGQNWPISDQANSGDSATGFFSSGTIDDARIDGLAESGEVDHDLTLNFLAAEHVDWAAASAGTIDPTNYVDLDTQLTQEQVEDFAGGMDLGTETRITFTYNDGTGNFDIVVDDMNDDVPEAGDFAAATDLDLNGALNTDSVSANELNATGVEAELEAVLDLPELQGTLGDAQVAATIHRDSETKDGDLVDFDDPDANFTATNVDEAISELFEVDGGGPNSATGKVDWSQLVNMPAGFADGNDASGGGGTPNVLDLGDDAGDDSTDLIEIATTGDTNNIFTESAADKLLINVGLNWPTADTANSGDSATGFFPSGTIDDARIDGLAESGEVDHDLTLNFLAAEHVDWAGVSAGTIHATNYVDNDTPALTQEEVEDFALTALALGTGTHTGITVTYQDITGDVDLDVDHDAATNFVAAEHVDWAASSAGTIHATNYVDNDTPALTQEQVEDFVDGLIAAGTHTGITWTYTDASGLADLDVFALDAQVDNHITLDISAAGSVTGGTASRCARFDGSGNLIAATGDCAAGDTGGGSTTFDAIGAGTNTNALLVGTGGSLGPTGTGTISATDFDINSLTTDASPDAAADFIVFHDTTAGTRDKVLLEDALGAAGVESGPATTVPEVILWDGDEVAGSRATSAGDWTEMETALGTSPWLDLAGGTLTAEVVVDDLGFEFTPGDTLTDCTSFSATGGGIFYDDSEGIFKKCQDNVLTDLDTGGGSSAFSAITAGTNTTAAMVVGTGASLAVSGTGTISATDVDILSMTTDAAPVTSTDWIVFHDATEGAQNKVLIDDALTAGGVEDAPVTTVPEVLLWDNDAAVGSKATSAGDWTEMETALGTSPWLDLAGGTLTAEVVVDDLGFEFTPGDTLTDCSTFAATGGGIFYDDSEGKLKKCEDNSLTDLDTTGGSPAFSTLSGGTNTSAAMVVGTGASLATSGTGTIVATTGDSATAFFSVGTVDDARIDGLAESGEVDHDLTLNFLAAEHVDWAGVSAGTIHATNYVDNDTPALTQEEVEDFSLTALALGTGTHTGITVTYQDATGDVDLDVDHDAATNFVAAEHVDWAGVSAGTIDPTNYVDNDTPALTQEQVEDFAGGMDLGTETRLTFTYNDTSGNFDIVVDDMNDDVPEAGDFAAATDLDLNGAIVGDAVALATDTTGVYVAGITGGAGITSTGGGAENATVTLITDSTEAFIAAGTIAPAADGALVVDTDGDNTNILNDVLSFQSGGEDFLVVPVREYPTVDGQILKFNATNDDIEWATDATGGTPAFGSITTGTNTVNLVMGTGGVLEFSGTGAIYASAATKLVQKNTAGTINVGEVVYVAGYDTGDDFTTVELADSDNGSAMPAIGIALEAITDTAEGMIATFGSLGGLNTNSYSVGDELYVDTTAGALTNTKPTAAGTSIQKVGVVARAHASQGVIEIVGAGRANDLPTFERSKNMNLGDPVTGDSGKYHWDWPEAFTITEVACSTDVGTVTINFEERAPTTPNTAGTDVLSAGLVCDTNRQDACASGCDVSTITNGPIDADDPVNLQIDATASSPTVLRVTVKFTVP